MNARNMTQVRDWALAIMIELERQLSVRRSRWIPENDTITLACSVL